MAELDKDMIDETRVEKPEESSSVPEGWQREIRCPITGCRVVNARPGGRKITSEEINRMIEEEGLYDEDDEGDEEGDEEDCP